MEPTHKNIARYLETFLTSFFRLFGSVVENLNIDNGTITGTLLWNTENESQAILWNPKGSEIEFNNMIQVLDYLYSHELVSNDLITITEESLIKRLEVLGWDSNKCQETITNLCLVRIDMVDNGKRTDSFFLHF